jgi:hypothetical protein
MRSSISAKIPKRSKSAFPNREYFTLICLLTVLMEVIFVFNQIVDRCSGRNEERVGKGRVGEQQPDSPSRLPDVMSFLRFPFCEILKRPTQNTYVFKSHRRCLY